MRFQVSSTGGPSGSMTRRAALRIGGLVGASAALGTAGAGGTSAGRRAGFGRARSCLLVFLGGGPSHLETFDLKPEAPAEVRGAFRPIATITPGIRVCEHLPGLARRADRFTVVRSLTHDDVHHSGAAYRILTGRAYPRPVEQGEFGAPEDDPHIGSIASAARMAAGGDITGFVVVTDRPDAGAGRHAGRLGRASDPLAVCVGPGGPSFDGTARSRTRLGRALDLSGEPDRVRDRYGRHRFGQMLLRGRRLVESGTPFVQVDWPRGLEAGWDTHADAFRALREDLLPPADRALSALLDDLAASGLLDETLVVVVGEFGRAPRVTPGLGGRGHWPHAFSALVAGAGLPGGRAYGASDGLGAYPADRPLSPGRLAATILFALGIGPTAPGPDASDAGGGLAGVAPALDLLG